MLGQGLTYGAARLSAAECRLELDGKEVANFPKGDFKRLPQGNYVSANHPIKVTK